LCSVFEVTRSCYYAYCRKRRFPDAKRVVLRSRVSELFTQSRSAAGSRSIMLMMKEDGLQIGRFKVRRLMREMNLISKQPGFHAYKKATIERPDIPNVLDREFAVVSPNKVWCGDITYIWAEGWSFSSKPDADLVIKALDMAYEQRGRPQNVLFHSDRAANTRAEFSARDCGDIVSNKA
jgi:putative transposase